MRRNDASRFKLRWLLGWISIVASGALPAQPYAFISASQSPDRGVYVVDLTTHEVERLIEGVGDEPSALQLSPDRRRLYVASWRALPQAQQVGMVYAIDTEAREVVASIAVGERQSRALALSPDGSIVYAWALALAPGDEARRLMQLDAVTLAPIDELVLPQPECGPQLDNALLTHPDGRVLLLACVDGLRWFDPGSQTLVDAPGTLNGQHLVGFSPAGDEVFLADARPPVNSLQSRLTALNLDSGAEQRFDFALPGGHPMPGTASQPRRLVYLQRPTDPPATPTPVVLFGSSGPLGFAQILLRSSYLELQQPAAPATRRLLASSTVLGDGGVAPQGRFAAVDDGTRLVVAGNPALVFDTQTWAQQGAAVALPGVSGNADGDVAIVPFPPVLIFADGFE